MKMAAQKFIPLLVLVFFHAFVHSSESISSADDKSAMSSSPNSCSGVRAAYWPASDGFPASSIDTTYFTHIYYAFLIPEPSSFKLNVTDFDQTKIPEFINGLRTREPPVKTLLSIGGGAGYDPTLFSDIAASEQTREAFINSTIQVARQYGFDGVDLDWEWPGNQHDMDNLALLFNEWYRALALEAKVHQRPRLLLTAAVYFASSITMIGDGPRSYPAEAIRKYLDWALPMCFDYHGAWDNNTGANAALYDPKSNKSTQYGLGSWIKAGVPPGKLVMGLPLYGRTWNLQDPNVHRTGAPAVGAATDTDGTMDYNEVLNYNKQNGASIVYDGLSVSFYSYAGTSWISYDDVPSIRKKVQFAQLLGLRGYFFWALGKDKDWTISRQASNEWGH